MNRDKYTDPRREFRKQVDEALRAWSARTNDSKTIRKDLGYKSMLGDIVRRENGNQTVNREVFEYDADELDRIDEIIAGLSYRDKILVRVKYQTFCDDISARKLKIELQKLTTIKCALEANGKGEALVICNQEINKISGKLERMFADFDRAKPAMWGEQTEYSGGNAANAYSKALQRVKDKLYVLIFEPIE